MDIVTYALSKKYTNDTVIGLGAIKGSPATVKSYTYDVDGNTIITFEWTATDDTKRTSTVSVKRGIDGRGIASAYFNEEGKLVIVLEGGEALDPITMPSASVEISKLPDNAITQKADGIYVETVDLDDYVEKEDGKSLVLDTDIVQISNNKDAIDILNGDNTVDGSVDKKIATAIGGLTKLEKEISETVPTVEEARDNVLYLVPSETEGVYEQWMLIGDEVVSLGSTEVDLSNYVEKVDGKGLSTNDYTDDDKELVETIEDKVDKVEGKGLSTNDFTDNDKDAVDSIENKVDRYATMPTPSSELSGTIAQYVGSGDVYQNGYFYICVQNDLGTWVWREKDVQKPADSSFKGTKDEWDDLSDEQKAQYETVIFTDDYEDDVYTKEEVDGLLDEKQDVLPTVVNDKYLHTNSTTGALEWSDLTNTFKKIYTFGEVVDSYTLQTNHVYLLIGNCHPTPVAESQELNGIGLIVTFYGAIMHKTNLSGTIMDNFTISELTLSKGVTTNFRGILYDISDLY